MIQLTQKTPGPKTWLSKTYKLPTLVTTERMHVFMEANDLLNKKLAEENPTSKKVHLLINRMIIED